MFDLAKKQIPVNESIDIFDFENLLYSPSEKPDVCRNILKEGGFYNCYENGKWRQLHIDEVQFLAMSLFFYDYENRSFFQKLKELFKPNEKHQKFIARYFDNKTDFGEEPTYYRLSKTISSNTTKMSIEGRLDYPVIKDLVSKYEWIVKFNDEIVDNKISCDEYLEYFEYDEDKQMFISNNLQFDVSGLVESFGLFFLDLTKRAIVLPEKYSNGVY